jgi:hypothetical protein
MAIKATDPSPIKRIYPHVDEIPDWRTAQTTRLLWDRIHDLEERLQASQTTVTDLVAGHNTNEAALTTVTRDARQALSLSQQLAGGAAPSGATPSGDVAPGDGGGDGGDGGGGGAPGDDGGGGAIGCQAAGPTGHDTGGLLNAIRAGQIVCGTGNEFASLRTPVVLYVIRQMNNVMLVRRMIWHLRQAGFEAGRQKNPSGAISEQKLCVVVDEVTRAYEVLDGVDKSVQTPTQMQEVWPANMQDDAGIPD